MLGSSELTVILKIIYINLIKINELLYQQNKCIKCKLPPPLFPSVSWSGQDGLSDWLLPDETLPLHGGRGHRLDQGLQTGLRDRTTAELPGGVSPRLLSTAVPSKAPLRPRARLVCMGCRGNDAAALETRLSNTGASLLSAVNGYRTPPWLEAAV